MSVLLLLAALAAPQEKDEAAELLRKVERALTANLSVRFTVRSELRMFQSLKPDGARALTRVSQVTVELAPGHRARIEGQFPVEGLDWPDRIPQLGSPPLPESDSAWMTLFSDGWTLTVSPYQKAPAVATAAPKRLNRSLISDFLRLGVRETVTETLKGLGARADSEASAPRESKATSWLRHPEATYLGREKVDGTETLKLQLNPDKGTGPASPVSTMWIDAKTFLPLRRETTTKGSGWEKTHEERYSEFKSEGISP